jgi:hypothetical protein
MGGNGKAQAGSGFSVRYEDTSKHGLHTVIVTLNGVEFGARTDSRSSGYNLARETARSLGLHTFEFMGKAISFSDMRL